MSEYAAARKCGLGRREAAGQAIGLALLRNRLVTAVRARFVKDPYAGWGADE